jgi:hypothetical protein
MRGLCQQQRHRCIVAFLHRSLLRPAAEKVGCGERKCYIDASVVEKKSPHERRRSFFWIYLDSCSLDCAICFMHFETEIFIA